MKRSRVDVCKQLKSPKGARTVPILFARVHMACCLHRCMAMEVKHSSSGRQMTLIDSEKLPEFPGFGSNHIVDHYHLEANLKKTFKMNVFTNYAA